MHPVTELHSSLSSWESFYVIVGSSGGALIGLQFVVITLIADRRHLAKAGSLSAFGTPPVVHLVCTEHAHQPEIIKEFPQLSPHDVLKKWLYIDSRHPHFESTMERMAEAIARDDRRFGIHPRPRKERAHTRLLDRDHCPRK